MNPLLLWAAVGPSVLSQQQKGSSNTEDDLESPLFLPPAPKSGPHQHAAQQQILHRAEDGAQGLTKTRQVLYPPGYISSIHCAGTRKNVSFNSRAKKKPKKVFKFVWLLTVPQMPKIWEFKALLMFEERRKASFKVSMNLSVKKKKKKHQEKIWYQ